MKISTFLKPFFMCILGAVMQLFVNTHDAYGQWQASGLIRSGSSIEDAITFVFKPVPGQPKVIACGYLSGDNMPGVSGKGQVDAFVGIYENGVFTQFKTFGGSNLDVFHGGLAIHPNRYVFWGSTRSNDGDITSHPIPGEFCGWIVFTDSLLNVTGSNVIPASGQTFGSLFVGGLNTERNILVFTGQFVSDQLTGHQVYWVIFTDLNGQTIYENQDSVPGVIRVSNQILENLNPDTFLLTTQFTVGYSSPQYTNQGRFYVWNSSTQEYQAAYSFISPADSVNNLFTGYTEKEGVHYFLGASSSCGTAAIPAIKLTRFDFATMQDLACLIHPDAASYYYSRMHPLQDLNMVFISSYYTDNSQSEGKVWMGHTDSLGNISASTTFGGTMETNAIASYFDSSGSDNEIILAGSTLATDGDFSATTPRGGFDFWIARFVNPSLSANTEISKALQIYPNPAAYSTGFTLSLSDDAPSKVWVKDVHGRIVPFELHKESNAWHCVPQSTIAPGLYFVFLQQNQQVLVGRIVLNP